MKSSASLSVEASSAKWACLTGDLKKARVIVAGGRGLGNQENFQLMLELAEILKAQVGGTRGALDAGWISHDREIGLGGARVFPELYLGFGLSGANFHTIGMEHAKFIIAVNCDPAARIHTIAHCSIVKDTGICIRQFTEYMRTLEMSHHDFDPVTITKTYFMTAQASGINTVPIR